MAKAAKSTNFESTPDTVINSDGHEWVDDLPVSTRGGGGAKASDTFNAIKGIPAPRTTPEGKQQFARRWFELTDRASENITDEKERAQVDKDNLRKLTNKLSGITRRLNKADSAMNYTLRSVEQNGVPGVAVYRIASSATSTPSGAVNEATAAPVSQTA